ncbi:hypothetical protein MXM45_22825 [Citrobacter cronae]|uniref:hypothetical protein n=1 Tax=Enterobacteriaceae TaxID=543 RepID=UPI0015E51203|nr:MULTISPECIES: hypothetical protein [Citrobacter]MEB5757143.1 hypothetical protein [Citrobacter cronae]QLO44302.1 hypothetical protein HV215_19995 [Citrobacter freundii]QLR49420.1 hypothetical protein HV345_20545 [Citrobacter sp. RHBSTW-00986]QLV42466.1 hypothetical protein HV198_19995 [Citrobacter freundii]HCJ6376548.1 hypothetical protein [Citrobacter freundii]
MNTAFMLPPELSAQTCPEVCGLVWSYSTGSDGLTPFDSLSIYRGAQLIAKQPCTGDG